MAWGLDKMSESARTALTEGISVPQSTGVLVGALARHRTRLVPVEWGGKVVSIGGQAPVLVQSMTNTDTADAVATAIQVKELALAGSEIVRITVNTPRR